MLGGDASGSALPAPPRPLLPPLQVPEGQVVMLSFRVFDLEPDPVCRYDHLDVYNGHVAAEGQRLGRFCGTFRPGAVLSTSNRMMLQMRSDEGTGGRGFLVWFSGGLPHVNGEEALLPGRPLALAMLAGRGPPRAFRQPLAARSEGVLGAVLGLGGQRTNLLRPHGGPSPSWRRGSWPCWCWAPSCAWRVDFPPLSPSDPKRTTWPQLVTDLGSSWRDNTLCGGGGVASLLSRVLTCAAGGGGRMQEQDSLQCVAVSRQAHVWAAEQTSQL